MGRDWNHGLCGCFSNCKVCILTFFCPCYVHGRIAEKVLFIYLLGRVAALGTKVK